MADGAEVSVGKTDGEPSDGQRILARGVELELGGERRRLLFTYEAIEHVENEFGTLQDFLEALRAPKGRAVVSGITACLLHEFDEIASPSEVAALRRHVQRKLRVQDFDRNFKLLWTAIAESLPTPDPAAVPKGRGSRDVSHGGGSSTSRIASASAAKSSGVPRRRSSARSSKKKPRQ